MQRTERRLTRHVQVIIAPLSGARQGALRARS